jgi:hypothetical protein
MPFACAVVLDGVSTVYDLPVESISSTATPPTVIIDGAVVPANQATPAYTFDYKHGIIVFPTPPQPQGGSLQVSGITYDYFIDAEVSQAVTDAFNLHVADEEPLPVIDPVSGELGINSNNQYLVSLMAAVELLWFRATDASKDIDIHTPEGVSLPRAQRYRQILQQIQGLQQQYKDLCAALGVGIWRIQILNQRRVSYTTNRLIPIFREQNYNEPYTGFFPTTGLVGALITINGKYFNRTTQVTFGGVPALTSVPYPYSTPLVAGQFSVVNDGQLQVAVPVGAMTGQIGVVTPYGVVLSTAQFVVGQPAPFVDYGPELVPIPIPPGH